MNYQKISKGLLQTIAVIAGIIILFYFLYEIKNVVIFIAIAAVISLIGRPIVHGLKKHLRFGNTAASFTTLMFFIIIVTIVLWMFIPVIVDQSKSISEIDFNSVKRDLNELNIQASEYMGLEQIDFIEAIKRSEYVQNINKEGLPNFVDIILNNGATYITGLFAVLFIAFFLLRDEQIIIKTLTVIAKPGKEERFLKVVEKIKNLLSRYFVGLVFQILILSILYTFLMLYVDVNNPLAIAVLCAFLNIVPYLGPIFALIIMGLVLVSNNLGADFSTQLLPLIITTVIGHLIAQLIDNLIVQPFVFGASVRSHPLEIFIVILVFGYVFGITGMILAIPAYTTAKVIAKEFLSEYKIVKSLTKRI